MQCATHSDRPTRCKDAAVPGRKYCNTCLIAGSRRATAWARKHAGVKAAKAKARRQADPEKYREKERVRYAKQAAHIRARQRLARRRWAAHDWWRIYKRLKRMGVNEREARLFAPTLADDNMRCYYCSIPAWAVKFAGRLGWSLPGPENWRSRLTIEHIDPLIRNDVGNLVMACAWCNVHRNRACKTAADVEFVSRTMWRTFFGEIWTTRFLLAVSPHARS